MYCSIDELQQADLDLWIREYNEQRPHFGRTPMQNLGAMLMAKEKMIAA
jgi:hypothetical protein